MRLLLLLLLVIPVMATAQSSRSAAELSRALIGEYLTKKIYKDQPYKAVFFGALEQYKVKHPEIVWVMEHKCEVLEKEKDDSAWQPRNFVFYFDKKMKIVQTKST